uniref:Uncharacterized protein n=1 Tax=Oryza glumipatula TaxID=40148 RepID=A0A0E0AIF8_9ORYZ
MAMVCMGGVTVVGVTMTYALYASAKTTTIHLAASGCGDVHDHSFFFNSSSFFFAPPRFYLSVVDEDRPRYQADEDSVGLEELLATCPSLTNEPVPWYQADNDAAGLGELLAACPSHADEPVSWYSPARGAEPLTPLMVAAAYGSVACLDVLLSPPYLVDPNRVSASLLSTPLHLAAIGWATSAPMAVSRLLAVSANDDDDEVEER